MPIRKTKPTSPGRRFATYQLREELTAKPNKELTKGKQQDRRPQLLRPRSPRAIAAAAPSAATAQIDFKRPKDGVPGQGRDDRVRPEPHHLHRPAALRRRREALHPRPAGPAGRRHGRLRRPAPTSAPGNALALRRDPDRHGRPQRRAEARPGRPDGPRRRHRDPGRREGGRDGHPAAASSEMRMVRAECRATVGKLSNAEHQNVKLGKAGRSRHKGERPQTPRHRDEPGRPSARRRRGAPHARRPPRDPVGQADARLPDPQEEQALRRDDRPRSPARQEEASRARAMGRSTKKGPFVEERLLARIEQMNESGTKQMIKTWSRELDDLPRDGRPHDRRPRRPQARARVRLRVDGRPQAGRVRAHAHVPGPLREQGGAAER